MSTGPDASYIREIASPAPKETCVITEGYHSFPVRIDGRPSETSVEVVQYYYRVK